MKLGRKYKVGVFAGPKVSGGESSDLVFVLDVGNTKSYVGSGVTITNLRGSTKNQFAIKDSFYRTYDFEVDDYVLPNVPPSSVTFSSSNGGTVVFDGIQNYLNISVSNLSTVTTLELWAKLGTNYTQNTLFGFGNYNVWCDSGGLGFNTSNGDLYGISSANVSTLGLVNNWKQYVFEMRSDVSYSNNKLYVNGTSQVLSQQRGTESSSNRNFNSGSGRIASWAATSGYEMPMTFSLLRIYNRSLTGTEISSNFNSTRGRFSI
jgi:hypothetical protein